MVVSSVAVALNLARARTAAAIAVLLASNAFLLFFAVAPYSVEDTVQWHAIHWTPRIAATAAVLTLTLIVGPAAACGRTRRGYVVLTTLLAACSLGAFSLQSTHFLNGDGV